MLQPCAGRLHYPLCCMLYGISPRGKDENRKDLSVTFCRGCENLRPPDSKLANVAKSVHFATAVPQRVTVWCTESVCGHKPGQNSTDKRAGTDGSSETCILLDLIESSRIPTWLRRTSDV
jgi:hypothetical protein